MNKRSFFCLVVLIFGISTTHIQEVNATLGMDISAYCTGIDWSCLVKNGYSFAIIQAWAGGYGVNTNIGDCVKAAWAAGMKHVDIYAFMCPRCSGNDPATAMASIKSHMSGVPFGQLWLDVEQCSGCWNDAGSNCAFVASCAAAAVSHGFKLGVYSSEGSWAATVGSCSSVDEYPLWYAHYDDDESFDDGAYHFGGWSTPAMKQFAGNVAVCGSSIDQDWYPDGMEWPLMSQNISDAMKVFVK